MTQRAGGTIQFASGATCCALVALAFEDMVIEWATPMIIAMTWSIFVLSFGAVTLLYFLIRHGAAANVASMFFLVPPCTAVFAWFLFEERLGWVEIAGMALAACIRDGHPPMDLLALDPKRFHACYQLCCLLQSKYQKTEKKWFGIRCSKSHCRTLCRS